MCVYVVFRLVVGWKAIFWREVQRKAEFDNFRPGSSTLAPLLQLTIPKKMEIRCQKRWRTMYLSSEYICTCTHLCFSASKQYMKSICCIHMTDVPWFQTVVFTLTCGHVDFSRTLRHMSSVGRGDTHV